MGGVEAEDRPPLASDLFDIAARPDTMGRAARSFSEVFGYPETTIVGSNPVSAKEIGVYLVQEVPLRIRPSRANGFSDFLRGDRVVSTW